jgi:hypothetical protein
MIKKMNPYDELLDGLTFLGVNVSAFAIVSLSELELILKCLLLACTIVWSAFKAVAAWRALKDRK